MRTFKGWVIFNKNGMITQVIDATPRNGTWREGVPSSPLKGYGEGLRDCAPFQKKICIEMAFFRVFCQSGVNNIKFMSATKAPKTCFVSARTIR